MVATIISPAADQTTVDYKVIIADHATPTSGTWAIYLNPENITEGWDISQVGIVNTGDDISTGTDYGAMKYVWQFVNCKYKVPSSTNVNWDNLKKAIASWIDVDNDTTLYLTNKNKNGYNEATWAVGGTITQCNVKINSIKITRQELNEKWFTPI